MDSEQLYRRYLNGDDSALTGLVELFFARLVLFANGYLGDIGLAEEAALDALYELAKHPRRFSGRSGIGTYLFSIARHKALDRLRRRVRESAAPLDESMTDGADRVLEEVLENEKKRELYRAVNELPRDMREAVHLVYFEGMTYSEAARVLKKSPKQVDGLLYRARKKLRESLTDNGESPNEERL